MSIFVMHKRQPLHSLIILCIVAFYVKSECESAPEQPKHLVIAMSSDRGMCGAIHSGIAKQIRNSMAERPQGGAETKFVAIGEKARALLSRYANKPKDMFSVFIISS